MFLRIAAMLRHVEVTFLKCITSKCKLDKYPNISLKKLGLVVIDRAIIKCTLQFNNHT